MKSSLPPAAVAAIIAVVLVIALVLGWKMLSGDSTITPPSKVGADGKAVQVPSDAKTMPEPGKAAGRGALEANN